MFTCTNYNPITIIPLLNYSNAIFSAVFTWTNLLVVVVELDGNENEALDLVPLVTNCVLEEHYLIVGVVVVVDPGIIPINSRGEKQRMHLRDGFLADQLDPIYVAYNMWLTWSCHLKDSAEVSDEFYAVVRLTGSLCAPPEETVTLCMTGKYYLSLLGENQLLGEYQPRDMRHIEPDQCWLVLRRKEYKYVEQASAR